MTGNIAVGKPFLKWVGGKRQLVPIIKRYMPTQIRHYYEPFMGGAALFFDLAPTSATLSDVNDELVNCYQTVRDAPKQLIDALRTHYYDKDYYYHMRNLDRDRDAFAALSCVERAARLLFLNRTGFNGMYRVNSKGQFNVPFGRYSNPNIVNEEGILAASEALQHVTIQHSPFELMAAQAVPGDFIYFDPPYVPLSDTSYFTSYAQDDFGYADQVRLAETCRQLAEKNISFIASNSYCDAVKELYQPFEFAEIKARRSINASGNGRQPVSEILIWHKAQ